MMSGFQQRVEHSQHEETLYVYVSEGPVTRTQALDHYRNVDLDAGGKVVGVEFMGVGTKPRS